MKAYFVYIAANNTGTLYVGVTNSLDNRFWKHKNEPQGFVAKYRLNKLVYFEETPDINAAIAREKQLKNWHRQWKLNLIRSINPGFLDLSESATLKQVQGDGKTRPRNGSIGASRG